MSCFCRIIPIKRIQTIIIEVIRKLVSSMAMPLETLGYIPGEGGQVLWGWGAQPFGLCCWLGCFAGAEFLWARIHPPSSYVSAMNSLRLGPTGKIFFPFLFLSHWADGLFNNQNLLRFPNTPLKTIISQVYMGVGGDNPGVRWSS